MSWELVNGFCITSIPLHELVGVVVLGSHAPQSDGNKPADDFLFLQPEIESYLSNAGFVFPEEADRAWDTKVFPSFLWHKESESPGRKNFNKKLLTTFYNLLQRASRR